MKIPIGGLRVPVGPQPNSIQTSGIAAGKLLFFLGSQIKFF
jgi:hypothetical protein